MTSLRVRRRVWDNCTQYKINAVEKIQKEAARIATKTTKLVSLDRLYRETGWESLEEKTTET